MFPQHFCLINDWNHSIQFIWFCQWHWCRNPPKSHHLLISLQWTPQLWLCHVYSAEYLLMVYSLAAGQDTTTQDFTRIRNECPTATTDPKHSGKLKDKYTRKWRQIWVAPHISPMSGSSTSSLLREREIHTAKEPGSERNERFGRLDRNAMLPPYVRY